MLVDVSNISVKLDAMLPGKERMLSKEISRACGCKLSLVEGASEDAGSLEPGCFVIARRSVDARKKSNVHFVVTVVACINSMDELSLAKGVSAKEHVPLKPLSAPDLGSALEDAHRESPIVVGAGPAGLFCAYYLAMAGLRPLVVERGKPVEGRMQDVEAFASGGALDPNSNVQFGEGGAGTFSDGKLNTGTKDPRIRHVLRTLVEAGAPSDILVDAKPHIGTDLLPDVVRNLRKRIEELGGRFAFCTKLCGIALTEDEGSMQRHGESTNAASSQCRQFPQGGSPLLKVMLQDVLTEDVREAETEALVLAIGHSARDTYAMLHDLGMDMERKPFAVGVRIEHLQSEMDAAQYGASAGHPALGAADYKLAVHNEDGRGAYTFCMCPGGTVVAAASEPDMVCVNGMSVNARDGRNSNSALLVEVLPNDLPGDDVLEGVRLQRSMESAAFELAKAETGIPYSAPAQTVVDFLRKGGDSEKGSAASREDALAHGECASSQDKKVMPSYPRGVAWVDLHDCLPIFVSDAMEEAIPKMDRKLHGFADPKAVMTGVEARSSSPVRLVRDDDTMQSVSTPGIYPAGEGAGYAGGIVSAAVDGLRVAEAVAQAYRP